MCNNISFLSFFFYIAAVVILISGITKACEEYEVSHSNLYNSLFSHPVRDPVSSKYAVFPESLRLEMLEETKKMFDFGYDSYMKYAFPQDELNPVFCSGRGPDYFNPSNININDILGNYSLTLVDTLDTLAIMGNISEFKNAVKLVIEHVSFDVDSIVQVFEVNIRLLGGLLSAHLLITDPRQPFGDLKPDNYEGQLLEMAHDLATRLLPAFENTKTGIPYPRVHLQKGVPGNAVTDTCTAGAGSLLVEFGLLSRLVGDPIYESYARRANKAIWNLRSKATGLLGNTLDMQSGKWTGKMSGLGAGLDSFFEYLLKSYVMFGQAEDFLMFNTSYQLIKEYMRKGRANCNYGEGEHPLYVNVDMNNGATHTTWIDALQAAFAGVQVLSGDIEEAICSHALYLAIWRLFGALPERFNWQRKEPDVLFYPLRPEFVESTYLLYQATRNPFYLHVGREILQDLNQNAKAKCGYATIHSVLDMSHEDRMESFFLSETCKYLFLLFDVHNPLNTLADRYIFTTEGHVLPVNYIFPSAAWEENLTIFPAHEYELEDNDLGSISTCLSVVDSRMAHNHSLWSCNAINDERTYSLPLKSRYLAQLSEMLGVEYY